MTANLIIGLNKVFVSLYINYSTIRSTKQPKDDDRNDYGSVENGSDPELTDGNIPNTTSILSNFTVCSDLKECAHNCYSSTITTSFETGISCAAQPLQPVQPLAHNCKISFII